MKPSYFLGVVAAFALLATGLARSRARPREALDAELARSRVLLPQAAARLAQLDHDLRTPVGTLMSAVSLLEAAPDDAQLHAEAIDVFSRQLARLTGVADALHDLALELDPAFRAPPTGESQPPWDMR